MSFFKFRNKKTSTKFDLVTQNNNFSIWGNSAYNNDIVRACVNAKALRISKLVLQHIRETVDNTKNIVINPEPYMRFLLEEPNRYMTITKFLHKISVLSDLTGNAFILILRDNNGVPIELYPIPAINAKAEYNSNNILYYEFYLKSGEKWTFPAADIIHIKGDYYLNDIFGDSKNTSLSPLLEVVETTDKGIINAIKNSSVIRWLLKYSASLRPEQLKSNAQQFAENYLSISNNGVGVAATDSKAEAQQVSAQDYVPNADIMSRSSERIMQLFNINAKILQSTANEDEENSYYEAVIEPFANTISQEFTRKLFTRRQRGTGNSISAGSFNLQSASIKTKLAFVSLVDRGAMTPNEWRSALGLSPLDGGDTPIRRLDTATVITGGEDNENNIN